MNDVELEEWFFNQKRVENECWLWTGVRIKGGYGTLSVKGHRFLCHRFSLSLHLKRPIPSELEVRHMCHNTSCINPDHLEEGTHIQNMNDMVVANRQATGKRLSDALLGKEHINGRGEKNGRCVLTSNQVREIRRAVSSIGDIAKQYDVSKPTILRIINRETWKHI
jgi:hypothetical protein